MNPDLVFDQAYTVFNKVWNLSICQVNKMNEQPPSEKTCLLLYPVKDSFGVLKGRNSAPFPLDLGDLFPNFEKKISIFIFLLFFFKDFHSVTTHTSYMVAK